MVVQCEYKCLMKHYFFSFLLIQHHWTSVFHLWSLICLRLLICLPAVFGHSWALFQETPWTSEWHRHCWQQLIHCDTALPLESFDWFCWPVQHLTGPVRPHVYSVPGWLYVQTPRFQRQRQGGSKEGQVQISSWEKDFQFLRFQSYELPNLGFWDSSCTFWLLCALCPLGKCRSFPAYDVFKSTVISLCAMNKDQW